MDQEAQLLLMPDQRTDVNVEFFKQWLKESQGWFTAAEILTHWGLKVDEGNRRWLRRLASDGEPSIIGGQNGYRHIDHATIEEISHCANFLESQATEMLRRSISIRLQAHCKIK